MIIGVCLDQASPLAFTVIIRTAYGLGFVLFFFLAFTVDFFLSS